MSSQFEDNIDAQHAFKLIADNAPFIFVTGRAGTGKSTWIRELRKLYPDMPVLCPTGLAALNVGGGTVHSYFKIPPRLGTTVRPKVIQACESVARILIDEISMLRADTVDLINETLKLSRNDFRPFGGCQIIVVGDNYQLPPVLTDNDKEAFEEIYSSPWWFDALVMQNVPFKMIEFTKVYRQTDELFISILNNFRDGTHTPALISELNAMCLENEYTNEHVNLCSTKQIAALNNLHKLDDLTTPLSTFVGVKSLGFTIPDEQLPSPVNLQLKVGARVMITKSSPDAVNGTLGYLEHIAENHLKVKTDAGAVIRVVRATWEQYRYGKNKYGGNTAQVVGTYSQFPLNLAWSMTIHKSQSLTIPKVSVDLGNGAFSPGQAYVAISRCTSLEGLHFARPIRSKDIWCDPRVSLVFKQ